MRKATVVGLLAFLMLLVSVLQGEGSQATPSGSLPWLTTDGGQLAWPDPDANGSKLGEAPGVPADRTDIHRPEDALTPTSPGGRLDATPPDPLVEQVAAALRNDPLAIYNYVKTEIAFEPVYGLKRDPHRTILERAGTDADQAFLLVELLRAAGVNASYLYGTVTLPLDLAASWVRVEPDPSISTTCDRILAALANGGVPVVDPPPCADNVTEEFGLQHVWVAADIGGVVHELDPSVKHNERMDGIDLGTALGYDRATFLANAEAGATITPESVANLNEANMGADLEQYAANLVAYIEAGDPHAYVQDIVGGWEIAEAAADVLPEILPYPSTIAATFSDFDDPDVDPNAPELRHKVTIEVSYLGTPQITYDTTLPAIAGHRLTYQCSGLTSTLRLEGQSLGTASCFWFSQTIQFCVDAPFPADDGSYGDECTNRSVSAGSGNTHALVAEVGRTPEGLLEERRAILAANQAAFPPESDQVLGETLNVLGLSWFNEVGASERLHEAVAGVNSYRIHGMAVMSQETTSGLTGFGIDARLNFIHLYSPTLDNEDRAAFFTADVAQGSGMEQAFIEQLQGKVGISTIGVLKLANFQGMPVFLGTAENWSIVRPQLSYSSSILAALDHAIADGYSLIVPQSNVTLNSWQGTGWIQFRPGSQGYILAGGLTTAGGSSTEPGPTDPDLARDILGLQQGALFGPTPGRPPEQGDPVDAQTGALTLHPTDITIRGSRPLSLEDFGRFYNSGVASLSGPLGFGWRHTYGWTLNTHSDYARGLEGPEAVEAARLIAQAFVLQDLIRNTSLPAHQQREIEAIVIKWGMDRLTDNALVLTGPDGANGAFLELPEGRFSRSARLPWDLIKNVDGSITLDGRAGEELGFDEVVDSEGSSFWRLTSWTDGNGNPLTLTYDAPGPEGKLTQVTDAVGRALTFTYYDGSNRIRTVTDPLPAPDTRTVVFTYDGNGDLWQVQDVKGGTTTYAYLNHRLLSITDPEGRTVLTNVYDDRGRVKQQTDGMLNDTFLYYGDHLIRTQNPRGDDRAVTWTDDGRRQQITDEAGFITTSWYDASGNLVKLEEPGGATSTFAYDVLDNLIASTDPLGYSTEFEYDDDSRLSLTRDPLDRQTSFIYDTRGNLTRLIRKDETGVVKALACFERDRGTGQVTALVESTDLVVPPGPTDPCTGHKTKFEYDQYGNPRTIVDPRFSSQPTPPQTTLNYDPGGRMRSVTNELGEVTTYGYDPQNNLLSVEDNLNNTTTYTYDAKGNLKTITDANRQPVETGEAGTQCGSTGTGDGTDDDGDTVKDDGCPSMIYAYDNGYRLRQVIDAMGHTTTYGYDANGNRTSVTNASRQPDGPAEADEQCGLAGTGNDVDEDGDGKKDDGCPSTIYGYDALNRLHSVTDALGRTTSYEYDAGSNLRQRTDARGLVTEYYYDALNRLYGLEHWDGTTLVDEVWYDYNDVGNRRTMVDPTGTTTYTYDALNRVKSVKFTPAGPPWPPGDRVVSYEYDNVGDRRHITYLDGKYVDYTYDEAHNMRTVTDWLGKTTTYTYDNAGRPTNVAYPVSGFSMAYGYDLAGRLTQVTHNTGALPQAITYALDAVGNRTSMQVGSQTPTTYQYDPLYRLQSVTYPEGDTTTYSYDPVGNRLTEGGTTYAYDNADELTQVGEAAYTYDGNGNLKTRGNETYDYDPENRLARIMFDNFDPYPNNPPDNGCPDLNGDGRVDILDILLYKPKLPPAPYDPLFDTNNDGKVDILDILLFKPMLQKECPRKFGYNGDGLRMTSELGRFWTDYTWDVAAGLPLMLQETYREKTMVPQETRYIKTYVYGLDLISVYTDDLEHGTTAQDYYFADGLGSTVTLARDSESGESAAWTYDAFGEVRTKSGTLSTSFLFTGEQFDAKARQTQGLYYLRARYYDPTIGRFLTRDPLAGWPWAPKTQNLYPYGLNDPANLRDPYGLCSLCDWVADNVVDPVDDFFTETVPETVADPAVIADLISLAGNAGPPLLIYGLATGNPLLIGGGVVLTGANVGAGGYSMISNWHAQQEGCIPRGEMVGRNVLLFFGFAPDPRLATGADLLTLALDEAFPVSERCPDRLDPRTVRVDLTAPGYRSAK